MSLADLLAYCAEHDIHGSYRCKQEGPEQFRAYIRTDKISTNGIDTTREKALDRIAGLVLEELRNPWVYDPPGIAGAYEGIYGRAKNAS